jgi:acyl carrier protein
MITGHRLGWDDRIGGADRCDRPVTEGGHSVNHDEAAAATARDHAGTQPLSKRMRFGTMSDIAERVKKIVVEHLGVEPEKVTENASFIDDLGADSLDTVELVMAFEEEFGCEIPDDAAETILTVGDAVKFLEKNAKS